MGGEGERERGQIDRKGYILYRIALTAEDQIEASVA